MYQINAYWHPQRGESSSSSLSWLIGPIRMLACSGWVVGLCGTRRLVGVISLLRCNGVAQHSVISLKKALGLLGVITAMLFTVSLLRAMQETDEVYGVCIISFDFALLFCWGLALFFYWLYMYWCRGVTVFGMYVALLCTYCMHMRCYLTMLPPLLPQRPPALVCGRPPGVCSHPVRAGILFPMPPFLP